MTVGRVVSVRFLLYCLFTTRSSAAADGVVDESSFTQMTGSAIDDVLGISERVDSLARGVGSLEHALQNHVANNAEVMEKASEAYVEEIHIYKDKDKQTKSKKTPSKKTHSKKTPSNKSPSKTSPSKKESDEDSSKESDKESDEEESDEEESDEEESDEEESDEEDPDEWMRQWTEADEEKWQIAQNERKRKLDYCDEDNVTKELDYCDAECKEQTKKCCCLYRATWLEKVYKAANGQAAFLCLRECSFGNTVSDEFFHIRKESEHVWKKVDVGVNEACEHKPLHDCDSTKNLQIAEDYRVAYIAKMEKAKTGQL